MFRTHEWAPRVLIANSNLVPQWATWEEFRRLEAAGLTMYGQMTAGSWIYIGTQGILQGTYETFAAGRAKRFGGSLAGTITLTAGLGGMGGAQPLAVTMNGGVAHLHRLVTPPESSRRYRAGLPGRGSPTALDDALRRAAAAAAAPSRCRSGCSATPPSLVPLAPGDGRAGQRGHRSDLGPRPLRIPAPRGRVRGDGARCGPRTRPGSPQRARQSMAAHVEAMVGFMDAGAEVFDYGNSIRGEAQLGGLRRGRSTSPASCPAYIRPLFCEGRGPFRWAALSGDPKGHRRDRRGHPGLCSPATRRWLRWMADGRAIRWQFQGLPARICWLGYGERNLAGLRFNELVRAASVQAPIVLGRDHLDCGSVASPYRETEAMADGSDAIADWPLLNALLNTSSGASWV